MSEWLKFLIPNAGGFLVTISTAFFAAFFSARWGARQAFRERWWDKKVSAYTEIIEALHDLIRYSDLMVHEELTGTENPRRDEFGERYSEAYWKIQKATDIGAFAICREATDILTNLRQRPKLDREENPTFEIYQNDSEYYKKALTQIREYALRDLKVR